VFRKILAQTPKAAERYATLTGRPVPSVGNLKTAAAPLPAPDGELAHLEAALGGRPRWVAASTHPGEETLVVEAHKVLARSRPDALTILVPRHPARGDEITALLADRGLSPARRSRGETPAADTPFWLIDTMGEMGLFYRLAPIVFVGGSLVPHGGHNLLEPALLGAAVLSGPYTENFTEIARHLEAAGGLVTVTAETLGATVAALFADPAKRAALAAAARRAAATKADVVGRVLEELAPLLPRTGEDIRARA
jgi:3-deoxy-D-manno-octulosonic-acid transferase